MLSSIGANADTMALVERTLQRTPSYAPALYFRGNLHAFHGRFNQAETDYEQSLLADPRLFQASWMLAWLRRQTPGSNHVPRLRAQLARATPGGMGEAYLAFALHKGLHGLEDYDAAWAALARGCSVKRALVKYAGGERSALFDEIIRVCTAEFVACVATDAVPVFIVGMHRSGTTLLERMIGGHPAVADAGGTYAFSEQMKVATDHTAPGARR